MSQPISNLSELISHMTPVLREGVYVFATLPQDVTINVTDVLAMVREVEGLTVVVTEDVAKQLCLSIAFRAAWISLTVHSDLESVGLTAAFAEALGRACISCNVMAGVYHDHVFVPVAKADQAMSVLNALQKNAAMI